MGKRKSSKPIAKKRREVLDTTFSCLFCSHEKSVTCKLDKKAAVGYLSCKVCGQSFQTDINALSAPVDIYSDWVDACEAVRKQTSNGAPQRQSDRYERDERGGFEDDDGPGTRAAGRGTRGVVDDEDDDE